MTVVPLVAAEVEFSAQYTPNEADDDQIAPAAKVISKDVRHDDLDWIDATTVECVDTITAGQPFDIFITLRDAHENRVPFANVGRPFKANNSIDSGSSPVQGNSFAAAAQAKSADGVAADYDGTFEALLTVVGKDGYVLRPASMAAVNDGDQSHVVAVRFLPTVAGNVSVTLRYGTLQRDPVRLAVTPEAYHWDATKLEWDAEAVLAGVECECRVLYFDKFGNETTQQPPVSQLTARCIQMEIDRRPFEDASDSGSVRISRRRFALGETSQSSPVMALSEGDDDDEQHVDKEKNGDRGGDDDEKVITLEDGSLWLQSHISSAIRTDGDDSPSARMEDKQDNNNDDDGGGEASPKKQPEGGSASGEQRVKVRVCSEWSRRFRIQLLLNDANPITSDSIQCDAAEVDWQHTQIEFRQAVTVAGRKSILQFLPVDFFGNPSSRGLTDSKIFQVDFVSGGKANSATDFVQVAPIDPTKFQPDCVHRWECTMIFNKVGDYQVQVSLKNQSGKNKGVRVSAETSVTPAPIDWPRGCKWFVDGDRCNAGYQLLFQFDAKDEFGNPTTVGVRPPSEGTPKAASAGAAVASSDGEPSTGDSGIIVCQSMRQKEALPETHLAIVMELVDSNKRTHRLPAPPVMDMPEEKGLFGINVEPTMAGTLKVSAICVQNSDPAAQVTPDIVRAADVSILAAQAFWDSCSVSFAQEACVAGEDCVADIAICDRFNNVVCEPDSELVECLTVKATHVETGNEYEVAISARGYIAMPKIDADAIGMDSRADLGAPSVMFGDMGSPQDSRAGGGPWTVQLAFKPTMAGATRLRATHPDSDVALEAEILVLPAALHRGTAFLSSNMQSVVAGEVLRVRATIDDELGNKLNKPPLSALRMRTKCADGESAMGEEIVVDDSDHIVMNLQPTVVGPVEVKLLAAVPIHSMRLPSKRQGDENNDDDDEADGRRRSGKSNNKDGDDSKNELRELGSFQSRCTPAFISAGCSLIQRQGDDPVTAGDPVSFECLLCDEFGNQIDVALARTAKLSAVNGTANPNVEMVVKTPRASIDVAMPPSIIATVTPREKGEISVKLTIDAVEVVSKPVPVLSAPLHWPSCKISILEEMIKLGTEGTLVITGKDRFDNAHSIDISKLSVSIDNAGQACECSDLQGTNRVLGMFKPTKRGLVQVEVRYEGSDAVRTSAAVSVV